MRHCPGCGREIDDGEGGCPACGTLLETISCDAHPDRDATGECVVCGRALCARCEAGSQRAHLCAEHRHVRVTEGWAEVLNSTSELEAQLVRDNLRAEGIEAQVYSQRDRIFSVELGELSVVRLLVPVWSYQEAAEAIDEILPGSDG